MQHEELAEALFAAFQAGDAEAARALCASDLEARQNDGPAMGLGPLLAFSKAVHRLVKDFRYEEAVRSATDRGFVEEHRVRGTLPDGSELDLSVCVVADVVDGRITSLREYLDSAAAAGLIAALS
ncbi:MAG: nuclear transport factor 2 family protein [Pseudomonadales bacterium]|jgi:ketosteroid isomerase-like protein|nr:nuclear transport factor 2 family protein [Pseudomonadales bacterium]